jgi:multidrug transporter EmrE-like cation transporter
MYACGALVWIPALKQRPNLAVTGTLWSVMTLLMTVGIGVFVFGESFGLYKAIGIVLAVGAVILLSL